MGWPIVACKRVAALHGEVSTAHRRPGEQAERSAIHRVHDPEREGLGTLGPLGEGERGVLPGERIEQPWDIARLILAVGVHRHDHVGVTDTVGEQSQGVDDGALMTEVERRNDHLDVVEMLETADVGVGARRVVDDHEHQLSTPPGTRGEGLGPDAQERLGVVEHRADDPAAGGRHTAGHRGTSATAATEVPAGQMRRSRVVVELRA